MRRIFEAWPYAVGGLVGTLAAHFVYKGTKELLPEPKKAEEATTQDYIASIAELIVGAVLIMAARGTVIRVMGGVMVGQGVLDALYTGKVITVQL